MTEGNESRVWNVLRLGADMQAGTEEREERKGMDGCRSRRQSESANIGTADK